MKKCFLALVVFNVLGSSGHEAKATTQRCENPTATIYEKTLDLAKKNPWAILDGAGMLLGATLLANSPLWSFGLGGFMTGTTSKGVDLLRKKFFPIGYEHHPEPLNKSFVQQLSEYFFWEVLPQPGPVFLLLTHI